MRVRLLILLCAAILAACAPPPDEVYNRGQELELEGRYEEAVDHYIRALERAPEMRKAQGRLHVAGGVLLRRYLDAAATAEPPEAADIYLTADRLRRRSAEVGIVLNQAPRSFESDRDAALSAAVEFLLTEGADALRALRYADALAAFERAGRYRPSPEQADALRAFAYDAHLAWAEADLAAGRFRAAFGRAEAARAHVGGDRTLYEIEAFQLAALDAGSVFVAVFPIEPEPRQSAAPIPRDFLADLDGLLDDAHWTRPPPFVRTADPYDVRRLLRRTSGRDGRWRAPRLTGRLARDLEADYGVATALTDFDWEEEVTRRDTLTAPLRTGNGTGRYERIRSRVTLRATADFVIVEAGSGARVCQGEANADTRGTLLRGEAVGRGDVRPPREDRDLFDEVALREAEREIEYGLQEELAGRLAERVYDCLLRQVP